MSHKLDNKHLGHFKVISVTPNHSNGTVTETMTNNNGEVLIRIGDSQPAQSNGVYDAFDAHQVIVGSQPVQSNGVYNAFDAHHVIYTKHSSATIYRSDRDPNTQSVRTRHIKKIRENGTAEERTTVDIDIQNNNIIDKQVSTEILFSKTPSKDACFYCRKTVYQKEKMGPIKDTVFHKQCFHCSACHTMLTFKNFCQNPNDTEDQRLYCKSHQPVPEQSKGHIDDKVIRDFINKPRLDSVNINIRGVPEAGKLHSIGPDSLQIQGPMHAPKLNMYNQTVRVEPTVQKSPFVDQNAVGIKTAMNAPRLDNYNQTVRPVPPLATVPVVELASRDPDHYKTRQVQHQVSVPTPPVSPLATVPVVELASRDPDHYKTRQVQHQVSVPTPPVSPQQVRFSTDTQTHYYNGHG